MTVVTRIVTRGIFFCDPGTFLAADALRIETGPGEVFPQEVMESATGWRTRCCRGEGGTPFPQFSIAQPVSAAGGIIPPVRGPESFQYQT